ncbi:TPA: restriction endonuclease subunit S [Neisseria gonorrhoeae]
MVELQEIFDVSYGSKLDLNKMSSFNPTINFVGRSGKNNGVTASVDLLKNTKPYPAGLLTVALGGSVLSTFLQNKPFYTAQNVAVLNPKTEMTEQQKLFYCAAIFANAYRFSACGREANRTLRQLFVPSLDEIPSWVESVNLNPSAGVTEPKLKEPLDLPVVRQSKRLDEIFTIQNGIAATKLKEFEQRQKDTVVYIRPASTQARTLRSYIACDSVDEKHIFPCHTLFTSTNGEGSHTYSYVSTCEFVANSDVAVLTPIQSDMPIEVKLYYAKCITANRYLFSYGRKPKGEKLKSIMLPYFDQQEDFDYICRFIHTLLFSNNL